MNEIEFNLIDEPWIRVMDNRCNVSEVSLKDAILNAHNYKSLSGELPTQDIAVMRLILAVLHTVYARADENGNESPLEEDNEDEALDRWQALWKKGHFSEKAIENYFGKWHERFWLFHPERPFYQITEDNMVNLIKGQKKLLLSKLNGEIAQGSNKNNFFSLYSGNEINKLSYAQAARWLVFTNSFDDTALKPQGKNLPSASVGWLGQLGVVYILGNTLFETLMLNLALINNDQVESNQTPVWEEKTLRYKERIDIPFPDNLAELYTLQSRRIHLFREANGEITHFHILAGDLVSSDSAFEEPMTAWVKTNKDKNENATTYYPQKHTSPQQMWREFSVMYNNIDDETPGIIKWYRKNVTERKSSLRKTILRTAIASIEFDSSSSHKYVNYFSDSLTMHAELLSELGADWRATIEREIDRCDKLAYAIADLAKNLYVASGGSNSKKDKHYNDIPNAVKSQLYYRFDIPFREWLGSVDPEIVDEKQKYDKQLEWQYTARKITETYAQELLSETNDTAIIGHKADEHIYSSPRAMLNFRKKIKEIYGEERDKNV